MSDKPRDRDPLLSGWVKALLAVATLFLLAVGVVAFLGMISTNRWHRYATELRAGGDPLTYEEIEAQRATVSEGQNGARVIERLFDKLNSVKRAAVDKEIRTALLVVNERMPGIDFFKGIDRSRIAPSRAFLERHRDILKELGALRDKPRGRFDMPQGRTPISVRFPIYTGHVEVASTLFVLDATMQLIDGEVDSAADTAILLFLLAGTLYDEPSGFGRFVQMSAETSALRIVEYALRVDELDVETLVELGNNIDDRLVSSTLKWAILGERAGLLRILEELARGSVSLNDIRLWMSARRNPSFDALPLVIVRMNQRRVAEVCTWIVDACDDLKAMTAAAQKIDNTVGTNIRVNNFLVGMLLPSFSGLVERHGDTVAKLRCAGAGLAAERFRLDNGRFPDTVDALVPRYLDAVPIDPFDQQPIRLAVSEDGIVIYSVGPDRTDDGGDVATGERRKEPPDRGFRLLKPPLRGLVILDGSADSG